VEGIHRLLQLDDIPAPEVGIHLLLHHVYTGSCGGYEEGSCGGYVPAPAKGTPGTMASVVAILWLPQLVYTSSCDRYKEGSCGGYIPAPAKGTPVAGTQWLLW